MSTQQEKFTEIANAIRAKKGTTDPIAANDFASEIASIETGGGSGSSGTSRFYLNKCILTVDDGYQIERIPIHAGDTIDLGEGVDVEASTNWGSYYHAKSHPEMTFQSWASSTDITNNEFVVPDDICTDYHVGAIYCTADGKNHYIEFEEAVGYTHRESTADKVVEGNLSQDKANRKLVAMWHNNLLTSIPIYAFYNCRSLTSVNIPNSVTVIDSSAFNSSSITSLNIPNSVTSLGSYMCSGCHSLTSLNIPNSVTTLTSCMFSACRSLFSLNIPNSVISIEYGVVHNCYSLTSLNIPNSVTTLGNSVFQECNSLTSLHIPDGITSIGMDLIYGCFSLTSFNIPNSVISIGGNQFRECRALAGVLLDAETPPIMSSGSAPYSYCTFLVPIGSIATYEEATNWSTYAGRFIENTEENRKKFGIW